MLQIGHISCFSVDELEKEKKEEHQKQEEMCFAFLAPFSALPSLAFHMGGKTGFRSEILGTTNGEWKLSLQLGKTVTNLLSL